MPLPFEGVKVVDLAQVWAVPGAAMYLADQGADVVKVEPLWGDEARRLSTTRFLGDNAPGYLVMNRNKRGIGIDIACDEGREVVYRLVRDADVVLLNYRPGVAGRLGYGYESLRAMNPRLIYVSSTPYGTEGEWAHRRGYDLLFQGLSGQLGRMKLADGTPVAGGRWTVDTAGAMGLAFGIAAALFHRERTGQGQRVDTSMLNMSLALQAVGLVRAYDDPSVEQPVAPMTHTLFRCSDGEWVVMIIVRPEDWRSLCEVLGVEHLGAPEHYQRTRDSREFQQEAGQVLQGVFETRPRDEWVGLLLERDFPIAPVLTPDEALEHPHLLANGMFVDVDHPTAGRLRMFAPPVRLSAGEPVVRRPGPALGQDTDTIMAELGYAPGQVAELRARKIVA